MYNTPSFCVHRTVLLCTPHRPTAYSVPSFYVHHTVLLCTPHRPTAYSAPSFYVHHTVLLCTPYRPIISIIPIAKANNSTSKQVGKQVNKQAYKQETNNIKQVSNKHTNISTYKTVRQTAYIDILYLKY